ncbi:MAG TPA: Stk1 family PASTA domain-containing Ser/Thr kinase [Aeromicrobium sp.]|nr:Stk1 family PASTA domain-containing Ser/Thr kinase [Aeromicrobium sp.]HKY59126.1 Stk1 family PASTA domain-containing Ser/Thr kinase [Aeromicrobium sp.]
MSESGDGTEPVLLGNRYELGGILGRGGMADVRIGRDQRLGRTVAIKQLRPDLASDDTFQARFRREAQSAASLNHPSIVAVYDTGEATDAHGHHIPYIVMEHVDGQTLRDVLRDGRKILPERALSIVADVLNALDYSHRQGIVHRDIKPANVMLTPDGQVKVMDFGIARALADASVTQTAAVIGTAQYLSPEQARGETVDARSDIYSTGCLLYELLAGRPPFIGESPVSVAYQHVREEARPPSQFNPDVSGNVDHIVAKALAKRTDERYQSAADMRADIERVLAGHAVSPPSAPSPASATAVAAVDALSGLSGSANATQVTQAVPAMTSAEASKLPPPSRAKQSSGRSKFAFWALALIALVLLSTAAWALLSQEPPADEKVAVPEVSGQPYDVAKSELEAVQFEVEKVEEPDPTVPAGDVISQDPAGGTLLEAGTTITLTVSTGKETVTMPSLGSYTFEDAKNLLESDQYQLKVEKEERDSSAPEDEVINSNPPEGSDVEKGSTVTLYVSRGEASVPNVVGKSVSDARNTLEDAGFDVEVNGPDDGKVTDQDPNAGEDLSRGETVEITSEADDPTPPDNNDDECDPADTNPILPGCQS